MSYFRNHIENVTFQPEETISRGGCVIETNMGTIDARLEKQFRVIEEMFQAEMLKSTQSIPEET
jgi:flagellar biosynthesis/type III secretory pathway protein FliH